MLRRSLWFGMWCLIMAGPTYAVLPIDRTATYVLYETPGDPESDVKLVVTLHLHAEELDGDEIGWAITAVDIERPATHSEWEAAAPVVNTGDGLWWVTHADIEKPEVEEFVQPPLVTGIADAISSGDDDLDIEIVGLYYDEVTRGTPFPITGALTYSLINRETEEPEEEGDDEPVEVPSQG